MKTTQALEAITDEGKFELIVTSVLRKVNLDYASIVHTGINSQGDTVKDPLDGFCLVPGSNPHLFLMVEHTITQKEGLEKKWLHDHNQVKIRKKNTQFIVFRRSLD